MNNKDQIYCMRIALESLERVSLENQSNEYKKIINDIKCYLNENCSHSFLKDVIDITPDKSKEVMYCEHCYTTYDI